MQLPCLKKLRNKRNIIPTKIIYSYGTKFLVAVVSKAGWVIYSVTQTTTLTLPTTSGAHDASPAVGIGTKRKIMKAIDGIDFIHSEDKAAALERSWARFCEWVRDHPEQHPGGVHYQGMHWTEIYTVLPKTIYKPGVLRVAHFKLTTKNIKCIRKERLAGGRIRWVVSLHWEGHCPACQAPVLLKRGPAKLIRRPQPQKLIRREKVTEE